MYRIASALAVSVTLAAVPTAQASRGKPGTLAPPLVVGSQLSEDCTDTPLVQTLGLATPGSRGLPRLEMFGSPIEGRPFHLFVSNARPLAPAVLYYGTFPAPTFLPQFGATLFPGPPIVTLRFTILRNGRSGPLLASVPVTPDLCGRRVTAQAAVLDSAAQGDFAFTKAVDVRFGRDSGKPVFSIPTYFAPDDFADLESADLDGDGYLDWVASADDLLLFFGLPGFAFEAPTVVPGGGGADIATGDFDGNGTEDLAQVGSGMLNVRLGVGDGTFLAPSTVGTGTSPRRVGIADMNGDLIPDLVWTLDSTNSRLEVLPGNGDGTFGAALSTVVGGDVLDFALADLDLDGNVDAVTASTQAASVLWGSPSGALGSPQSLTGADSSFAVDVADLNGDTQPDLAFGQRGLFALVFNTGNRTFSAATVRTAGSSSSFGMFDVRAVDLDDDGVVDVAGVHNNDKSFYFLRGRGGGAFAAAESSFVGNSPSRMTVGDFDEDGQRDVAVAGRQFVKLLLGPRDDTFVDLIELTDAGNTGAVVALGDLNGDQVLDLVRDDNTSPVVEDELTIALGNGNGTFGQPQSFPASGASFEQIEILDVDGDFTLDVLALSKSSPGASPLSGGQLVFLRGSGNGSLAAPVATEVENPSNLGLARRFAVADLDRDGTLDAVVAVDSSGSTNGSYVVLLGTGGGTFGLPRVEAVFGSRPWDVALARLDGDSVLDLVLTARKDLTGSGPGEIRVHRGTGGGFFGAPDVYPLPTGGVAIAVDDVDDDGDADIVVSGGVVISNHVTVVLGVGDGTFVVQPSVPDSGLGRVHLLDMNGDGLLDILAGPFLHTGRGDGTFDPPQGYLDNGGGISSISGGAGAIGDMNGDLLPDFVTGTSDFFSPWYASLNRLLR